MKELPSDFKVGSDVGWGLNFAMSELDGSGVVPAAGTSGLASIEDSSMTVSRGHR